MLLKVQFEADCSCNIHQQLWPNTCYYGSVLCVFTTLLCSSELLPTPCRRSTKGLQKKRIRRFHFPRQALELPCLTWEKMWICSVRDCSSRHKSCKPLAQRGGVIATGSAVSPVREAESGFLVPLHQPVQGSVKVVPTNTEGARILPVFLPFKWRPVLIFQARVNYATLEWKLKWDRSHKHSSENNSTVNRIK